MSRSIKRRTPKVIANVAPGRAQGMTVSQLVRKANRWRDGLNPFRGLAISRVVTLLEAGERGEFADLQWTYRLVERRFPVLRALIARRAAALQKLDWDIRVSSEVPKGLEKLAEEQQLALREAYDRIENLREAIKALAKAEFRGYAHLQKHRNEAGDVRELHWLPQWNWVREGQFGGWAWNPEARTTSYESLPESDRLGGELLPREDFVYRECEAPIDEIGIIAFVNSAMARKDWSAFVEIFGLPNAVVVLPPNVPPDREGEYEAGAVAVAEGASGALPHGADVKFPTGGVRSGSPFKEFLEWEEKDVVLAGTGGKLTMLTEAGSGTLAGGAHQDTFDTIAAGEADEISECLQRDLDAQILDRAFPGKPRLAYFELAAGTDRDSGSTVDAVVKLAGAGYRVSAEEVSEKTGLEVMEATPANLPSDGPDGSNPVNTPSGDKSPSYRNGTRRPRVGVGGLGNRVGSGTGSGPSSAGKGYLKIAQDQVAAAAAADLAPILRRLSAIQEIQDPDIRRARLEALKAELASLEQDVLKDPEVATAMERVIGSPRFIPA
jgi:phage gp29-like protein